MPLTKISAPRHVESARVKALADAVQDGLVQTCNVPPKDLFQLISRFEIEEMILDQTFGDVNRSRDACIAEITLLQGRTDEQKRQLFRHIVERAVAVGFRPDDVMIALTENSRMDWSVGLGVAYADHVHAKSEAWEPAR
jgi:phenylpyruvate tautomerase PptA (4-oxalocrotonate tautomerase family)